MKAQRVEAMLVGGVGRRTEVALRRPKTIDVRLLHVLKLISACWVEREPFSLVMDYRAA